METRAISRWRKRNIDRYYPRFLLYFLPIVHTSERGLCISWTKRLICIVLWRNFLVSRHVQRIWKIEQDRWRPNFFYSYSDPLFWAACCDVFFPSGFLHSGEFTITTGSSCEPKTELKVDLKHGQPHGAFIEDQIIENTPISQGTHPTIVRIAIYYRFFTPTKTIQFEKKSWKYIIRMHGHLRMTLDRAL